MEFAPACVKAMRPVYPLAHPEFVGDSMECGGKRSATPLWRGPRRRSPIGARSWGFHQKAPSSLRSAGALQIERFQSKPPSTGDDPNKPLISKLLAVPSLRARYLGYVRDIPEKWLDWNRLGPIAQQYHSLTAADVKTDRRKLSSTEAFSERLTDDVQGGGGFGLGGRGTIGLKNFADQRRTYLLKVTAGKK
jgi:hypothetical protein